MEPDALTFLSYELIVYLVAPVIILLLISVHKESYSEQPVKDIRWFGVALLACHSVYAPSIYELIRC